MAIDLEQLRRHFSSLSDEGLREINREDLVEQARRCYDEEMASRGESVPDPGQPDRVRPKPLHEPPPDGWLETAAIACSFSYTVGRDQNTEAEEACAALETAGIPCSMSFVKASEHEDSHWDVLVPAGRVLQALSVLDCEIFNPRTEANWRSHLEGMSDDDLAQLTEEDICAGILDRAARLKNAFEEELRKRGL